MANSDMPVLTKSAALTPKSDKKGVEIFICSPPWFDEKGKFKIANAPRRTADLEFDGADLNFMSRVLYAESSGSVHLPDAIERQLEKAAIMNVNHFRLNRKGYPNDAYIAKTFLKVCKAPGQFESVSDTNQKFNASKESSAGILIKSECADLCEAIAAVLAFMTNGPRSDYQFDNFRGYNPRGQGTHIGRSRFFLSDGGVKLLAKNP